MKNGSCNLVLNKRLILTLFSIALIALFMSYVLAVTASIGNARMILRANVGDTIQKTILVKNINNETINIEITASGDLAKDIKILDSNFTLKSGEERDARFTIKITKNGAFENKINVKFYSPTEQKGVILSSNVVVMVNTEDNPEIDDNTNTDDTNDTTDSNTDTSDNKIETNPIILLLSVTGIVLLIFFVLLIVYYVRNGKENVAGENNTEKSLENNAEEKLEEVVEKTKSKKRTKKK